MDREIKFRAWDKKTKQMCPVWSIGWKTWDEDQICFVEIELNSDGTAKRLGHEVELVEYTGLKDMNGKEIYEGDIVESDLYPFTNDGNLNYRGEVSWEGEEASWALSVHAVSNRVAGRACGGFLAECFEDEEPLVVVGNIYENPELLEGKTQ